MSEDLSERCDFHNPLTANLRNLIYTATVPLSFFLRVYNCYRLVSDMQQKLTDFQSQHKYMT